MDVEDRTHIDEEEEIREEEEDEDDEDKPKKKKRGGKPRNEKKGKGKNRRGDRDDDDEAGDDGETGSPKSSGAVVAWEHDKQPPMAGPVTQVYCECKSLHACTCAFSLVPYRINVFMQFVGYPLIFASTALVGTSASPLL